MSSLPAPTEELSRRALLGTGAAAIASAGVVEAPKAAPRARDPIQLATWSRPLFEPHRYKVLYGGRASGKTWQVAAALVIQAAQQPLRIACVREHQKSIAESAKRTLERWIEAAGLTDRFVVQRDQILGRNGSQFFFRGMSTSTEESIRGWESVDRVWVEEAQRMSERSREILYPTIRKPGSEIWLTWNPRHRYDPVYRDFVASPRPGAFVRKVNFMDNPWLPAEADEERLICKRDEPDRYPHIWLGEPDDEGAARQVLPYGLLQACVDAWDRRGQITGRIYAGLDVADSGADKNALVARRGPAIIHVEEWSGSASSLGATARRVHNWCQSREAAALYYDVGGVGAGIRSHLAEIGARSYSRRPVNFGGKVQGAAVKYTRQTTNADFFSRANAQMGWAVRLRANMTRRLLDGDDVSRDRCLFIDPRLPRLEGYLAQLSQPEADEDASGRMTIDKTPDDAPSPDRYDGTVLAFARDSRFGLRNPS